MFSKTTFDRKQRWCRMLISRASTAAEAFSLAVRLRRMLR